MPAPGQNQPHVSRYWVGPPGPASPPHAAHDPAQRIPHTTESDHCRPGTAHKSWTSDPAGGLQSSPDTQSVCADQSIRGAVWAFPEPGFFPLRQENTHLTAFFLLGVSFLLMDRLKASDQELLVLSFLNKEMEKGS